MFPNKIQAVGISITLIAVQLLIAIFLSLAGLRWEGGDPLMYLLITFSSTAIVVRAVLPVMNLTFRDLFHANFNNPSQLIFTTLVPIALITIGLHVLLSNLFNIYYHFFPSETVFTKSLDTMVKSGLLGLLSVCLIAPIAEEIIYRGIILRGLLANYSKHDALFTSAILFSLAHLNPDQLVHTLVLGYFFGWLYIHSYSLWTPIIAHILFNTGAVVMSFGSIQIDGLNHFPDNKLVFAAGYVQVFGLACLVIGLVSLSSALIKAKR